MLSKYLLGRQYEIIVCCQYYFKSFIYTFRAFYETPAFLKEIQTTVLVSQLNYVNLL